MHRRQTSEKQVWVITTSQRWKRHGFQMKTEKKCELK